MSLVTMFLLEGPFVVTLVTAIVVAAKRSA